MNHRMVTMRIVSTCPK